MPRAPHKFTIIAGVHIGTDPPGDPCPRIPSRARSLLKYVVAKTNTEIKPAFVVQLGDLIEAEDAETDEENYDTALEVLADLTVPRYFVVGHHDQVNLKIEQIKSWLKYPKLYYSFDSGPFHFVVLFSKIVGTAAVIEDAQRQWLEKDIAETEKPVIVFTHFPLNDDEIDESQLEASESEESNAPAIGLSSDDRRLIRTILSKSGKVRAVFNGHLHKNALAVNDGIGYVSVQSLVRNISKVRKDASESYAVVSLFENETKVEIEGMDPAEYRF